MPNKESSVQRCFKFPFSSCEILSSEQKEIYDMMFTLPPIPEFQIHSKNSNDDEVIHEESNSKEHIELSPETLERAEEDSASPDSKQENQIQEISSKKQEEVRFK